MLNVHGNARGKPASRQIFRNLLATVSAIAATGAPALAQVTAPGPAAPAVPLATDAPDPTTGDIVVTARRRSETLQSVPVTISAFGEAQFQKLQISDVTDLNGRSPNVQITKTGGGTGALQVFIRGIGQDALAFNVENPVGLYLDDVYLGCVQGSLLDMLDFERVEILRGPQGTLYGRNSTVGAVKYITKQPDMEQAHYRGSLTLGNFHRADVTLGASVPIIPDVLAVKLDVGTRNQDGYIDIVDKNNLKTGQHGSGVDRRNARLAVRYTPSSRLTIDLSGDYGIDRSGSSQPTPITCTATGCTNTLGSAFRAGENGADQGRNDAWGLSARVQYDLGPLLLKSISSYRNTKNLDAIDFTGGPGDGLVLDDQKQQHQVSQEFQIATNGTGPLTAVAGLFYFNENIRHYDNFLGIDRNDDHQVSNSYAGFAEASYALTDRWHVTAGGRYSIDDKRIDRVILAGGTGNTLLYKGGDGFETKKFTYKLGTDYKITPDVLGYVTYATGYRPGGYVFTYPTQSQVTGNAVLLKTDTESSRNLEVGLKSQLFSHRLTLNLAGFLTKYLNLQQASSAPPFPIFTKDVKIKGIEAEFDARPIDGLSVYGSLGYLHSRIASGTGAGQVPRYNPEFQYSLGTLYTVPVRKGISMFVGGSMTHTSSFRTDDSFQSAVVQGAYTLFNAQLGAEFHDGRYRVSLDGKNLGDVAYFLSTNPGAAKWYAPPRTVSLTLATRF